jgi:hypothetical protein
LLKDHATSGEGVTSLVIEHFDTPTSTRDARAVDRAGERVGDVLAGRTMWCATSLPSAVRPAEELRVRMDGAGPNGAAAALRLSSDQHLLALAETVDDMLAGAVTSWPGFDRAASEA